jgi:hypothetical protein
MYLTLILFDFSNIIIIEGKDKENMGFMVKQIMVLRDKRLIYNMDVFRRNIDRKTFELISRMLSFVLSHNKY